MSKKYIKICETCGAIKEYSCIQSYSASKKRKNCNKCKRNVFQYYKDTLSEEDYNLKLKELKLKWKEKSSGKNNPMYGKSSYNVLVEKYGKPEADKRWQKHNENTSKHNTRPMLGKSVYSVWLEKYGKEIADQKLEELKKKQSINSSGENNPMYGKPPPNGSGNGWKGWYKNWFFRSLRELSYMINIIEKENLNWETGEKIKIEYIDYKGIKRTYRPDFIINKNKLIEIKPKKLHNSPSVLSKMNAALEYCKNNNLEYELTDCIILSDYEILNLYNNKIIKFSDRYNIKFIYYINKKKGDNICQQN